MYKLEYITKKFNNSIILNNISLELDKPNLYIITGINGSGKSTLIKIMAKIIFKSSGNIISDESIAYLPDKFSFPSLLSVKEFIIETLRLYKIKLDYRDIMKRFELPNKLIGSLSKGNYQKLGLFFIFYNNKDVYILDEPLDGLDDFAKNLFKELVEEKLKEDKKIILSLHNKTLLNSFNPKIFQIKEGNLVERQRKKKE